MPCESGSWQWAARLAESVSLRKMAIRQWHKYSASSNLTLQQQPELRLDVGSNQRTFARQLIHELVQVRTGGKVERKGKVLSKGHAFKNLI